MGKRVDDKGDREAKRRNGESALKGRERESATDTKLF